MDVVAMAKEKEQMGFFFCHEQDFQNSSENVMKAASYPDYKVTS